MRIAIQDFVIKQIAKSGGKRTSGIENLIGCEVAETAPPKPFVKF
jgi:hypothetical protein